MILVLGGTAEARALAGALHADGIPVTTSLAGRVTRPRLPDGATRIGGFGGPEALARWLIEHSTNAVIDATHPFAVQISASAGQACAATGIPLLRLERPGWSDRPGDRWIWVDDLEQAANTLAQLGERVFLTTGRQGLVAFAGLRDAWFLIRCVDPPEPPLPPRSAVLLDRGPYTLDGELDLIDAHEIEMVVTKDSGGTDTEAKLDAARERGLPVVIVRRPPRPQATAAAEVADAVRWALALAHAGYLRGV